jgi:hypothetical protein
VIIARPILLACVMPLLVSCASNRAKTLVFMGSAGAVMGTVGAALTPPSESPVAHGALWGAVAATVAGAAGLFIFDEEARRREAEGRIVKLEKELAAFREASEPVLLGTNRLGVSKPLPDKFKNLVTPGEWSLYRVDRWSLSGESELVHQDMIFRFQQPQLNPGAHPEETGEKR